MDAKGPSTPPPSWLDAALLTGCVEKAIDRASVSFPTHSAGRTIGRRGRERDIRELVVQADADSRAIAAYIAKYATKTADGSATLAHPVRSQAELERLDLRPHVSAMVRTAWRLGLARSSDSSTCGATPTPSATPGSSPPRASASPPPLPPCGRPLVLSQGWVRRR